MINRIFIIFIYLYFLCRITSEQGNIIFKPETIASIGKGYGLIIADVDGDGKQDILLADVWDLVWFWNGD